MATPRIEQETTITWNEGEGDALVWSASPVFQRRMAKLGIQPYQVGQRDGEESRAYRIPKKLVRINLPRKAPELTDEERKVRADALRERFAKRT